MITVDDITFDITADNEAFPRGLYRQWESFFRTSFEYVIDEVLSRFDSPDEIIQVESLTLDLGVIPEEEFYDQFPRLFGNILKDTFSDLLRDPQKYSQQLQIIPTVKNRLKLLSFYLQNGYLPWMEGEAVSDIEQLLNEVMRTNADELRDLIRVLGENAKVRERMIWQLSDAVLESIVVLIEPSESNFINTYTHVLVALYPYTGHPEISRQNFHDVVHNLVFAYLLYPNRGYFVRKQFVRQTIYGLAQRYNIHALSLIDLLSQQVQVLSEGMTLLPELFLILNELRKETDKYVQEAGQQSSTKSVVPARQEQITETKDIKRENKSISQELLKTNVMDTTSNQGTNVKIAVKNAGLVLLSPFFPRLFSMLKFLDPNHKFISTEQQQRAVFILQYLVSNGEKSEEADLMLNKVFVDYPQTNPLPKNIELTAEEIRFVNEMLMSAKDYWSKMRNVSKEGFIDSFIKRNGILEDEGDKWFLKVDNRPFDMLLESVPWGFRMARAPYMDKILMVEWK